MTRNSTSFYYISPLQSLWLVISINSNGKNNPLLRLLQTVYGTLLKQNGLLKLQMHLAIPLLMVSKYR